MVGKVVNICRVVFHSERMPYFLKKVIWALVSKYRNVKKTGAFKCYFPLTIDGKENLMGKEMFKDENGYAYVTQYYSETFITTSNNSVEDNYIHKNEIFKVKNYPANSRYKNKFEVDTLLPICMPNHDALNVSSNNFSIDLICHNKQYKLENILQNRYHHFSFKADDTIELFSSHELNIGKPLALKQDKRHDKKLVLTLFIDAFSASLLDKYSLEEIVPNTFEFFSKGTIFRKCYSNAEFTIPSLASMFTGQYVHNNNFFHPRKRQTIGENQKTISQYFEDEGYLTQLISSNPNQSPHQGYCLGFDRTVYKHSLKHQDIVHEYLDSLRIFKQRDTFSWLSFLDVHHGLNHIPSFSADCELSLSSHNYQLRDKIKTPFLNYCPRETERYLVELKKLDYHLKVLYDYIDENYTDEEMLVTLVSDHGHSFTDLTGKTEPLLRREKLNVPFMLRGNGTKIISDEIIENVDILPTILNACNIDYNEENLDGCIPKIIGGKGKEYIFSESIYPNQTYKATIKDKNYEAFLESKVLTTYEGDVDLTDYAISIIDINDDNKINEKSVIEKYETLFKRLCKW